jgi:hypothetical protein
MSFSSGSERWAGEVTTRSRIAVAILGGYPSRHDIAESHLASLG